MLFFCILYFDFDFIPLSFPLFFVSGYEKTEDTSEKTSLADQEDSRLIFLNQPQFTKFCNNRVR